MRSESIQLTLDNCAREPIHIPGSIQAHGALLAVDARGKIQYVTGNAREWFGQEPKALLGQSLKAALKENSAFGAEDFRAVNPVVGETAAGRKVDIILHRSGDLLLLEVEDWPGEHSFGNVYRRIQAGVEEMRAAPSIAELSERVVKVVKELSGYQRVMVYEFDREWNGRVTAEAKEARQEPFLGLHYPASDIPAQARALYLANWLRFIPDVNYAPAPILSNLSAPLDLSSSVLRAVSPMHIQYLKNMGVGASMSVSLKKDDRLWGLIACHHDRAAFLPFEVRQGLEFIGKVFSLELAARETRANQSYRRELRGRLAVLREKMRLESEFLAGLTRHQENFLGLSQGATGGAVYYHGKVTTVGEAPAPEEVHLIVDWLKSRREPVVTTDSLARELPAAEKFSAVASGLLALSIPEVEPGFVMWFKPELVQTVNWGGDPEKAMELTREGGVLGPRRSFQLWRQTVRLTSPPFSPEEFEAAEELRHLITEEDLHRQVQAALLSNEELDQFAYIVAHDLKEPLRGIGAYADFLSEDLAGNLSEGSASDLRGIKGLADRAKQLIAELYEYSKLGKVDLAFAMVDLNEVLSEVTSQLAPFFREKNAKVRVVKSLPNVWADRVRVKAVFQNLLSNSAKYSDKNERNIEVGWTEASPPIFWVKDDGIGIEPENEARVFRMFERLHGPDAFGGGTGCGLPIVKRIVERHGGKIWLESRLGEGATFFFTLSPSGEKS